jgi:hypothetical protein
MKTLVIIFFTPMLFFQFIQEPLSKKERKFALDHLNQTKNDLIKSIKGLNEEQLNFKADSTRWSIADCVEHLALTEVLFGQLIQDAMQKPANPAKRSEIKFTDEVIIAKVIDRSGKAQAPEIIRPSRKFANATEALKNLKGNREKAIQYLRSTQDDLRNHLGGHPLFGVVDVYQMYLLMSAHCKRHTLQIEEVKSHPSFPK